MATELSKGKLFDTQLVTEVISKVKGHSSLAKLSPQKPVPFNGQKEFTFDFDSDIDIVAENGKKTHGGVTLEPVTIVPLKVEYGSRISDEFLYASEEAKIDMLSDFVDGFAKKLARGLDIMAFHGINPRTKQASAIIGDNCFDKKITQTVDFTAADPDANMEDAVGLIDGSDRDITGAVLDPIFTTALSKVKNAQGGKLYPDLAWGSVPNTINGLKIDKNRTTSYSQTDPKNVAIVGDFETMFKWGYAKQVPMEIIKYGDPDNSGRDLKGYNQVYVRCEAYIGWGIMDAASFARIIKTGG
ncbi:phage major capsid protein [Streptococcus anginosus]|uniref:phage major capsid protein n=1 Tax=Streptococcus anginosus TaxID=1328 RepID=UPI003CEE0BBA